MPTVDTAASKRASERATRLNKAPVAAARSHRPAKYVKSGLDATSELYYQAEQKMSGSAHSDVITTAEGQATNESEERVDTKQQQGQQQQPGRRGVRRSSRRQATDESAEDESSAVGEEQKSGAEASEPVDASSEILRGKTLFISTKPDMVVHYEQIAQSLGARVR